MPRKPQPARTTIQVHHSLSEAQAKTLRTLIRDHAQAQVALSWAGGGDPLDRPSIEAGAALASANLEAFIARLVRDGE